MSIRYNNQIVAGFPDMAQTTNNMVQSLDNPMSTTYPSTQAVVDSLTEVNLTPFSLLDCKWSDKLLNNASWLRSAGQSNSGSVYSGVWTFLIDEYNDGTETTETIGDTTITFHKGTTGIKVTTDKTSYDAILAATGTAWYYVIDTTDNTFVLPQTNGFLQIGEAGTFNAAGLPNITATWGSAFEDMNSGYASTGAVTSTVASTYAMELPGTAGSDYIIRNFSAADSNAIYDNSETVQPNAVTGYLYFYVGSTIQNASLIDVGTVTELIATLESKIATYEAYPHIIEAHVDGTEGYNIYSNGYCEQWGQFTVGGAYTLTFHKEFVNTNYQVFTSYVEASNTASTQITWMSINSKATTGCTITNSGSTSFTRAWRACGYVS